MPGLVGESGGFGFVREDILRFGPSVLESGVAGHVGHQMLAGGFELIADQPEVEQEDPEVVLGALGVEVPLAAGGGPAIERLGGDREAELQVGLDPPAWRVASNQRNSTVPRYQTLCRLTPW